VQNARRDAFRIQDSTDCLFENNVVHDCTASMETSGIRLRLACSRMTVRGNEIYTCSRGIVCAASGNDIVIEGNYVHDLDEGVATETGISVIGIPASICNNVVARCDGTGIEAAAADLLVEGNVVFNCGRVLATNGFAIGNQSNVVARRNVSFNNAGHGFFGLGETGEHNVAFGNGAAGVWVRGTQILRNNIAFRNNQDGGFSDIDGPGTVDSDANFWADGVFPAGEGANSLSGDPGLVLPPAAGAALDPDDPGFEIDPTDSGFGDVSDWFGLLALSPAVDAGVDVGLPFNGAAPDMGAFERD
ncbi:MAG: right-handed parallel beta-helix repeat-containing protein, partial [Planctomycetota bacterium]|nr:right-handed parallel beta-helix repeat-containing protein [Planctomycetota bacterium]